MKRVLLGVALATLLIMGSTASAATSASCGLDLSVHNAGVCTAADKVDMVGEPSLGITVGIGPVEGIFYGDVQATLRGDESGALLQLTCVYRVSNALGALGDACLDYSQGTFIEGEAATCSGIGSGVGQWTVSCQVEPVEEG